MLEATLWIQVLLVAGLFAFSAQVTIRTKNVVKGGLCLYGLLILWSVLFGVAIPGLLRVIHHTPDVPRLLPETIGVLSVSLFGLVAAFAFAGVVRLAHTAADWFLQGVGPDRPVDRLMRFLQRIGFRAIGKRVDRFGRAERALYPKWVGIVLGYLLPGSAHVLGGCRRAGVAWFLWFPIASFLATCLIAIPGLWSLGAGVAVGLVLLVLWLLMLKHSYRPTRRIGWLGWLVLLVIVVWLGAGEKSLARVAIHPFRMSMGSMQPTLWGIHVREVDDKSAHPGLIGRLVRGERYVRWQARQQGILHGPNYLSPDLLPFYEYRVGADTLLLPRSTQLRFRSGERVEKGDLLWSGCIVAGDRFMVEKITYRLRNPRRGEIVVFKTDGLAGRKPNEYHVLRVAGLPGERVRVEPPWLLVNGERVIVPPIFATMAGKEQGYDGFLSEAAAGAPAESPSRQITLGEEEYFVLGDNARDACDSRDFGPVPRRNIIGRVTRIYWPLNRIDALEGRW
jgi:signal peptidase I